MQQPFSTHHNHCGTLNHCGTPWLAVTPLLCHSGMMLLSAVRHMLHQLDQCLSPLCPPASACNRPVWVMSTYRSAWGTRCAWGARRACRAGVDPRVLGCRPTSIRHTVKAKTAKHVSTSRTLFAPLEAAYSCTRRFCQGFVAVLDCCCCCCLVGWQMICSARQALVSTNPKIARVEAWC